MDLTPCQAPIPRAEHSSTLRLDSKSDRENEKGFRRICIDFFRPEFCLCTEIRLHRFRVYPWQNARIRQGARRNRAVFSGLAEGNRGNAAESERTLRDVPSR